MPDLPLVWAWLVAFAVLAYVLLDGFDLGIGVLTAFFTEDERDTMIDSVAPVWDGNETWLVFGGATLFAAFPLAYAILLPAFYAPLIAMLLALVFRGVSFEFRGRARTGGRRWWDYGFACGSIVAAFSQGVMLGAFIQGVDVVDRAYAGGWFDWLTPFTVLTGSAVLAGYTMLGAGWLILKTRGPVHAKCRVVLPRCTWLVLIAIVAVSVWTPFIDAAYAQRWFSWPNVLYVAPVPIVVATLAFALFRLLRTGRELATFLCAQGLFVVAFAGFGVSVYPYIVPRSITIDVAASSDSSLAFLLVGTAVLLPIILVYTAHAYWVFRGKADPGAGYH
jgi:cytochrome bd ubiquinol oxidase subunit II